MPITRQSSQARRKGVSLKTTADPVDPDAKFNPERPISAISGMCRGINTDVPNDVEDAQVADKLITAKAAAPLASVKRACKISLDDS